MSTNLLLTVAAAGCGRRLCGQRPHAHVPKPLAMAGGKPLICYTLEAFEASGADFILTIQSRHEAIFRQYLSAYGDRIRYVYQNEPRGTGDAIYRSFEHWQRYQNVIVSWADLVWPTTAHVSRLISTLAGGDSVVVPAMRHQQPYVGLELDDQGYIRRVVESREGATGHTEVADLGMFGLPRAAYGCFRNYIMDQNQGIGNRTGEKNFLPFLTHLYERQYPARALMMTGIGDIAINTATQLHAFEQCLAGSGLASPSPLLVENGHVSAFTSL